MLPKESMQAVGRGSLEVTTFPNPYTPRGACTMTTTTTKVTTAADFILAIDLGKYKSVACLYGSAECQRFTTFATSREENTAEAVVAFLPEPKRFKSGKSRRAGIELRRVGAEAVPVERVGSPRPDQQARSCDVAEALGRVRLVPVSLQRLGPGGVPAAEARRQGAEEAGYRGQHPQAPGAFVVDAA